MIEFMSLFSECKLLPKPKAISLPSSGRVFCEMFHPVHVRGICIKQSKRFNSVYIVHTSFQYITKPLILLIVFMNITHFV